MDDLKAASAGFAFSILGSKILGFLVYDLLTALILGGVGALGGWVANRLLNRYFPKKKKDETNH